MVNSYLFLIKDIIIFIIIFIGLSIFYPSMTLAIFLLIFVFYIIYKLSKDILYNLSNKGFHVGKKLSALYNFFYLGIKEIVLYNLSNKILDNFIKYNLESIILDLKKIAVINLPRTIVEISIYILIVLYFLNINSSEILISQIPTLALLLIFFFNFMEKYTCGF